MPVYDFEAALTESVAVAIGAGRTREWAESVATFDPFAGDFGDGSERTLDDRLVIARRRGPCRGHDGECKAGVAKGEITRVIRMVDGDGFYGGRICVRCLDAAYAEDHGEDDGEVSDA